MATNIDIENVEGLCAGERGTVFMFLFFNFFFDEFLFSRYYFLRFACTDLPTAAEPHFLFGVNDTYHLQTLMNY